MTDFSFAAQDQIKAIISQKMAEYQSAMEEISQSETEAIFADFAASAAEKRADDYSQAVTRWEGIKASYTPQSIQSNVLATLQMKVASAEQLRDQMLAKAKDAAIRKNSFNLLEELTGKLDKKVGALDKKIEACTDEQQKAELIKKRDELKEIVTESKEIQNIKDDKEAMRRFQGLAEKLYITMHPDKNMTTEQKQQQLQAVKPVGDNAEDYFDSVVGIWGLFTKATEDRQAQLEAKINKVKTIGNALSIVSPLAGSATNIGATIMQAANTNEMLTLEQQKASYDQDLAELEKIKKMKNLQAIKNIDEKVKQVQEHNHRIRHCEFLDGEENHGHGDHSGGSFETTDALVFNQILNNASEIKETKNLFEDRIQQNFDFVGSIENDIFSNKGALKDISTRDSHHKFEIEKQAENMVNGKGSNKDNKDDLVSKIASFVAGNTTDDARIVLQKSLFALKDQLSDVFGDRVVVDKREGSRRSNTDRREINANIEKQEVSNNRDDVAGRRKGDRRQSNHIFISEETIKNLNIKS